MTQAKWPPGKPARFNQREREQVDSAEDHRQCCRSGRCHAGEADQTDRRLMPKGMKRRKTLRRRRLTSYDTIGYTLGCRDATHVDTRRHGHDSWAERQAIGEQRQAAPVRDQLEGSVAGSADARDRDPHTLRRIAACEQQTGDRGRKPLLIWNGRRHRKLRQPGQAPAPPWPTMVRGSHTRSNVAASTSPEASAASRKVEPSASAFSAMWAAFW